MPAYHHELATMCSLEKVHLIFNALMEKYKDMRPGEGHSEWYTLTYVCVFAENDKLAYPKVVCRCSREHIGKRETSVGWSFLQG